MNLFSSKNMSLQKLIKQWRSVMADGPSFLTEKLSQLDTPPISGKVPKKLTVARNPWEVQHWDSVPKLDKKFSSRNIKGVQVKCELASTPLKKLRKLNSSTAQTSILNYMRPRPSLQTDVEEDELLSPNSSMDSD
eukprot:TRINITY_DN62806_c0_g2_i1.p1 TRINITY_DN62806_c0_g2~~TRINITY_DN62806_c0_g2_i1.p1  ORF type:complete len:135 (+),score=5.69 TRINITY_DN62806_c0_g2_i1:383-787(+)